MNDPIEVKTTTRVSALAISSLILSILSFLSMLFCIGIITAIPAIIFGHIAKAKIISSNGNISGKSLATSGLIIGYIAFVVALLMIAIFISGKNISIGNFHVGRGTMGSAGFKSYARKGQQTWEINGKKYNIESTYLLEMPKGLQFTIEYTHTDQNEIETMDDADIVAFPLMKYAFENKLYARYTDEEGQAAPVKFIGVVIYIKGKFFRTNLALDEIEKRVKE